MKISNPIPLQADPANQKAKLEEQLHGAAKMYENHFLNEMVKAMRSTVHKDEGFIKPSMAENIFSEQLDQQYVDQWADKGGIGLSDMIYQQLHERIFPERRDFSKPQGPVPLDKTSTPMKIQVDKKSDGHGQILIRKEGSSPLVQSPPVQNPWPGRIEASQIRDGWNHVTILHDQGLRSQLAFQGALSQNRVGESVAAGQTLGYLSPEAATLRWDVAEDG